MLAQQVAKKYSGALLELAKEHKMVDLAWEQLKAVGLLLKKDKIFLDFMSAPQVSDKAKEELIRKAFAARLEKPLFNFMLFLERKRRIVFLPEIVEEFDRLVKADKGIIRATCITTAKISDADRQRLIEKLTRKTSRKIELDEKIDKNIIGGMIVILHNKIIDGSLRYGLDQLRNRLMKVRVH